jgi:DNA-directed RNA polymerase specialized sigma24 family protein
MTVLDHAEPRAAARVVLRGDADVDDHGAPDDGDLATARMDGELRRALDRAVEALPDSQRMIVRALLREPASYDEPRPLRRLGRWR